jgi:acyl dehydratase
MRVAMRTWDDFEPGQVFELGGRRITAAEIVEFGRRWDPQPFHVDEEAAADGPFGGLVASGWHACAIWMRLYVDALLEEAASMGSPGVEELRWLAPLRPDEHVSARLTVLERSPSSRRADRGTIVARGELLGAAGATLMTMRVRAFFGRRASGPDAPVTG